MHENYQNWSGSVHCNSQPDIVADCSRGTIVWLVRDVEAHQCGAYMYVHVCICSYVHMDTIGHVRSVSIFMCGYMCIPHLQNHAIIMTLVVFKMARRSVAWKGILGGRGIKGGEVATHSGDTLE